METGINIPRMTAWLTINRACNLRCSWCYAKMTGFSKMNSMSMPLVESSVRLLKDLSLESVILIGGEPTIHPKFLDIVRLVKLSGLKTYLVTNAIKLSNPKFLDAVLSAGISSITVSFKASNAHDYKKFTGKDAFERTLKAIRNICETKVHHVVNITACEALIKNFDEMIEVIAESGAKSFSVDSGKPIILADKTYADGMGSPEQMAKFFMEIYPKLKKAGINFSVKIAVPFCLFPRTFIDSVIEDGNILTGCQMVSGRGIIIDPEGKLVPCNHLCHLSFGGLGKDFVTAEEYVRLRRKKEVVEFYKAASACPHENCVSCSYWEICGAGCKLYWLHYDKKDLIGNFEGGLGK